MRLKRGHLLFLGAALSIVLLYFLLRIPNLLGLPIFTDEAIYVRWAQIAAQDASWRFISLTDGKQPMFVWMAMILMKFFHDPLFAGRAVSIIAGFATTVGLFFLGNEIFKEKTKDKEYRIFLFTKNTVSIGLLSSFIYVIYSFGLVYDRMAMYDSLVGAFAVWSLFLLILTVRSLRLDVALIAGLVVGGGLLTKTNAFFSLGSIPLLLVVFSWKDKNLKGRLVRFALLSLVVVVLSGMMYSILRLSPFYHIIAEKNALFAYPINEWLKHPFKYFYSNLHALLDWFVSYVSIPAIILMFVSFFIAKEYLREKILLVLWFLFPFTYLSFFGNTIYPRFILFMTLSLVPLIAYSTYGLFEKYKNIFIRVAILIFAFGLYLYADYFIVFDFAHAPIPNADTGQFVNNWSAGNGVAQSAEFFKREATDKKIYIVTEGTFGLMPYGLEMYLVDNPNVKIQAIWPIHDFPPKEVSERVKSIPTYAIFYQPCGPLCKNGGELPDQWNGKKIASYRQGISGYYYNVYRLLP